VSGGIEARVYGGISVEILGGKEIFFKEDSLFQAKQLWPKIYCVALSGPPLGLNDYSLASPTRRLQIKKQNSQY
jgi:hypothetical protein